MQWKILRFKNMDVKDDITEHIFVEVVFQKDSCNVCDDGCSFGIIEGKNETQDNLIPKCSKDEMELIYFILLINEFLHL